MYCEKCGRKLKPGERCSCEKGNIDRSAENSNRGKQRRPEKFSGKAGTKKSGENIYIFISLLLLLLGGEIFWYFQMGTDNFLEQIPVAFVAEYKKYFSYGILIIIFAAGIVCGKIACRRSGVKAIAALTFLLNFLACVAACGLCGKSIYQRYKVLKICDGEWTEASAKKIEEVYSEAEWDDPLRTDIQNAVLKKIGSVQNQYDQKEIDYKSADNQLELMGTLAFAEDEVKEAQNYVEEAEKKSSSSDLGAETESKVMTEQPVTELITEKNTERIETERITEKYTEQSETEWNVDDEEADAEKNMEFIDAVLSQADQLIENGDTDQARKILLQAYNTTKSPKIQEKLDALSTIDVSSETENSERNTETSKETEKSNVPQSGIHRYEYCLLDGTWEDAYRACLAKGGHLVTFETQEEFDYVTKDLNNKNQQDYIFFLGGRRDLDSRQYYWVDVTNNLIGNALNTADVWNSGCWLHDEPSFEDTTLGLQEHVLSMFYYDDLGKWVWNDVPNDLIGAISSYSGKVGYICEYEE